MLDAAVILPVDLTFTVLKRDFDRTSASVERK